MIYSISNTYFKRMVINQFKDFMLVILLIASFASFAIAEYLRTLTCLAALKIRSWCDYFDCRCNQRCCWLGTRI
jgi:hypothetical protein